MNGKTVIQSGQTAAAHAPDGYTPPPQVGLGMRPLFEVSMWSVARAVAIITLYILKTPTFFRKVDR